MGKSGQYGAKDSPPMNPESLQGDAQSGSGSAKLGELLDSHGLELTIGVEVHVELSTATKMFCACPNVFGGEPNTRICPVCLGLPGSLPVLNRKAVELAIRVGIALHSEIAEVCLFHRKNYFYPDMPKNYQISQYDEPLCRGGYLDVPLPDGTSKRVGIVRAHLEEDTGKSVHLGETGRIHEAARSLEDYNRAGVPLLEIVSAPDIASPLQARAYVAELRQILLATGVSDVKMEEGSLRCDANISVTRKGSGQLGTKIEIKNMNSLRSLQKALEFEGVRQAIAVASGESLVQETRHWNERDGKTHPMRSKEEAEDYRYFPEPDLVPLSPEKQWVADIEASMPELPEPKRKRLVESYAIERRLAEILVANRGLDDLFEAAVHHGAPPKQVANWITGEVLARINESGGDSNQPPVTGRQLAGLLRLIEEGRLSTQLARQALDAVIDTGKDPEDIVEDLGLAQVSDETHLAQIVAKVIAANPEPVARYKAGEEKLLGYFVGRVMQETRGKANPRLVNELLKKALSQQS
mgnify:FL=1